MAEVSFPKDPNNWTVFEALTFADAWKTTNTETFETAFGKSERGVPGSSLGSVNRNSVKVAAKILKGNEPVIFNSVVKRIEDFRKQLSRKR